VNRQKLAFIAIASMFAASANAQQDFSNVQIETVSVAPGVFMLIGSGGNIGLSVGDDGAFIIDSQYAPLSEKIQAAVNAAGGATVEFVINTHWHGDHVGGNANFANAGAVVMAQDNVRTRLQGSGAEAAAIPTVTFPDRMSFHWNGNDINLIHVAPAHTDGDSIIHFTNLNVFHMGDTFVNGGYPFVDLDSAGSFDGIIAAGEAVLARANSATRIIPGHGALATREDLEHFIDVLKTIRGRFQSLIDQGRSEDQVVAAGVTSEWDATWGTGFMSAERFTRLAYQSLTRQ
jgi:glyoxylase-like metal-dependent hydrolase (beta-lactamase superfamily II)